MRNQPTRGSVVLTALGVGVLLGAAPAPAARYAAAVSAPTSAQRIFTTLITALKNDDYTAFTADGEATFRATLQKSTLDQISAQLGPRLKGGYQAIYLGEMKQKGYQVYLWKLSYEDQGDDSLASVSLKAGKVGGFFID